MADGQDLVLEPTAMVRRPTPPAARRALELTSPPSLARVAPLRQPSLPAALLLLALVGSFAYYTLWTLLTPLLPLSSPLQACFPARKWAIRVPVGVLLLGLAVVLAFVGWQGMLEARRLKSAASTDEERKKDR